MQPEFIISHRRQADWQVGVANAVAQQFAANEFLDEIKKNEYRFHVSMGKRYQIQASRSFISQVQALNLNRKDII